MNQSLRKPITVGIGSVCATAIALQKVVADIVTLLNRIAQTRPSNEFKINLIHKGMETILRVQVGKQLKLRTIS